jgi:large subunit ribosomal protein L6
MLIDQLVHTLKLPEGVNVDSSGPEVKVTGPRGDLTRHFEHAAINFEQKDGEIKIIGKKLRRKDKAMIGTWRAHLANMIKGVNSGFRYEMKIVFAHFPMKVAAKGNTITIDNFLGEKATRTAAIADGVEVKVKEDIVTIEGNNVEHVGQTAANLEKATVVKGRDIRVFQDGVYTISKGVAQ